MNKLHYPNLNFLRCMAAFLVIIHHTEQLKSIHGYSNFWGRPPVLLIGKLGVNLFFVLSGFLITSLLLVEKEKFERIAIKKFLMRRVLRIWPLYFLVVFIAFFITPHIEFLKVGAPFISPTEHFLPNILLYLFFLPHIQVFLIGPILYCAQAWSIGIEEYFYLFWPFVVNKLNEKRIIYFILVFILVYLLICHISLYLADHQFPQNILFHNIHICLVEALKFDCLLVGALFGILHSKFVGIKLFITKLPFQLFLYALEIILVLSGKFFNGYYWEIHAVIYGLIIFNLVRPSTSIINMEYPVFNFLGKISYGKYMYHFLIINLVMSFVYKFNIGYMLYPLSFISIILISFLSYNYVETYFLKKKLMYSKIVTG